MLVCSHLREVYVVVRWRGVMKVQVTLLLVRSWQGGVALSRIRLPRLNQHSHRHLKILRTQSIERRGVDMPSRTRGRRLERSSCRSCLLAGHQSRPHTTPCYYASRPVATVGKLIRDGRGPYARACVEPRDDDSLNAAIGGEGAGREVCVALRIPKISRLQNAFSFGSKL